MIASCRVTCWPIASAGEGQRLDPIKDRCDFKRLSSIDHELLGPSRRAPCLWSTLLLGAEVVETVALLSRFWAGGNNLLTSSATNGQISN
jgi:hypothetical protein